MTAGGGVLHAPPRLRLLARLLRVLPRNVSVLPRFWNLKNLWTSLRPVDVEAHAPRVVDGHPQPARDSLREVLPEAVVVIVERKLTSLGQEEHVGPVERLRGRYHDLGALPRQHGACLQVLDREEGEVCWDDQLSFILTRSPQAHDLTADIDSGVPGSRIDLAPNLCTNSRMSGSTRR